MGKSEQEVAEILITLINSNITDPATDRASKGKKWIYDDIPREDITGYPRISIVPISSTYESVGLGYSEQLEDGSIQIMVMTNKTDKFGGRRAEQLVDYLAIQIRNLIRTNHTHFVSNDIQHLIPETNNRTELDGRVINTMTFKYVSVN